MTILRFLNNCQQLKPEPELTSPVAAPAQGKKRLLGGCGSGSTTLVLPVVGDTLFELGLNCNSLEYNYVLPRVRDTLSELPRVVVELHGLEAPAPGAAVAAH